MSDLSSLIPPLPPSSSSSSSSSSSLSSSSLLSTTPITSTSTTVTATDLTSVSDSDQPPALTRNSSSSKLNAKAPEFVPMKPATTPSPSPPPTPSSVIVVVPTPPPPPPPLVHVFGPVVPVHHPHPHHHHHHPSPSPSPPPQLVHHHFQQLPPQPHDQQQQQQQQRVNNSGGSDRHQKKQQSEKDHGNNNLSRSNSGTNTNGLSDEAAQKLINQVEYYFSDVNLATTDHLIKFIFKDPEGFVPISVVASFKKIKALISGNSQLAAVLRNSTKLAVSEDGKKVKRINPLTSSDMDELQARIIVAENLPDDHCHQNLMKIFSTVGSVKSIRTCQPQPSNNGASSASRSSKTDNYHYNNKVHAFVEYESVELAEKALVELNVDSWRNGLRVRPLQKQVFKPSPGRAKKPGNDGEVNSEEVSVSTSEQNHNDKPSEHITTELDAQPYEHFKASPGRGKKPGSEGELNSEEEQSLEKESGQKKNRSRGKGKGRGRGHNNNNHNHHQHNRPVNGEQPVVPKQPPPGPRMPDGTRGFSMGRGKPISVNTT